MSSARFALPQRTLTLTLSTSHPHKHIPTHISSIDTDPSIYKGADVLVIPTHGEGWGRPQLEAMAMGLPVITTKWVAGIIGGRWVCMGCEGEGGGLGGVGWGGSGRFSRQVSGWGQGCRF